MADTPMYTVNTGRDNTGALPAFVKGVATSLHGDSEGHTERERLIPL